MSGRPPAPQRVAPRFFVNRKAAAALFSNPFCPVSSIQHSGLGAIRPWCLPWCLRRPASLLRAGPCRVLASKLAVDGGGRTSSRLNLKARPVSPKSYIPGCWAARSFASNATLTAGGGERSACSFAACQPRIVAEDARSPTTKSSQTPGIVPSVDHDGGLLMHGWPGGCGRSSRTCSSVLRLGFFCFIRMQTHSGTAALAVA